MCAMRLLQKADRRLNAQLLERELDDTLESLQGLDHTMGSSAMTAVRGNARKQSVGAPRTKDKADRATYQTVLDPRTRLVQPTTPAVCFYVSWEAQHTCRPINMQGGFGTPYGNCYWSRQQ